MIALSVQKKLKISLLFVKLIILSWQNGVHGQTLISGCFCEGGLIYGQVSKGSRVIIDEKIKTIFDDGFFIHALGRKSKDEIEITINGIKQKFDVKKKKYKIERISGLTKNKVQPNKKSIEKIMKDNEKLQVAKSLGQKKKLFNDKFLIPVDGRLSGVFGSQRVLNGKPRRPHYGIDIAAPQGTKILSPSNGFVKLVSNDMFFADERKNEDGRKKKVMK